MPFPVPIAVLCRDILATALRLCFIAVMMLIGLPGRSSDAPPRIEAATLASFTGKFTCDNADRLCKINRVVFCPTSGERRGKRCVSGTPGLDGIYYIVGVVSEIYQLSAIFYSTPDNPSGLISFPLDKPNQTRVEASKPEIYFLGSVNVLAHARSRGEPPGPARLSFQPVNPREIATIIQLAAERAGSAFLPWCPSLKNLLGSQNLPMPAACTKQTAPQPADGKPVAPAPGPGGVPGESLR